MHDSRSVTIDEDVHTWARETLKPGDCYWVIRRFPDGRPKPRAELHRIPPATIDLRDRSLDDMATEIAVGIRRAWDAAAEPEGVAREALAVPRRY